MLKMASEKFRKPSNRKGRTSHSVLPTITVTDTMDTSSPTLLPKASTPRVCFISSPTDVAGNSTLHHEIQCILRTHFNTRSGSVEGNNNRRHCPRVKFSQENLRHANDVYIYLFSRATLEDPKSFHSLFVAVALKLPVIFVRGTKEDLPRIFMECIRSNNRGCHSLLEYIEKHVLCDQPSKIQGRDEEHKKIKRPSPRLAPLFTRGSPTPSVDLNVRGVDIEKAKNIHPLHTECDFLPFFLACFQRAVVYSSAHKHRFSEMIKRCVYNAAGISTSSSNEATASEKSQACRERMLQVPESESKIPMLMGSLQPQNNTRPSMRLKSDPSSDNCDYGYNVLPSDSVSLGEKETTYLIYKDSNGCKRISYPPKEDEIKTFQNDCDESDSDEFDPSGSPIQIPDIDLGMDITFPLDPTESGDFSM